MDKLNGCILSLKMITYWKKIYISDKVSGESTDFHNKEIHKVNSYDTWLEVKMEYKNGNYYPQEFLKEWKCTAKEVIKHIIEDPKIYSDESDEE